MPVPIQTAQMMVQAQIAQVIFRQWRISLNLLLRDALSARES
jgi:hypothetical protein